MRTNSLFLFQIFFITILTNVCDSSGQDNFQHILENINAKVTSETQKQAAEELIKRVIPSRAGDFVVEIDPNIAQNRKEAFKLLKLSNGKIQVIGSTGVAATWGFHHYLKYICKAHISWESQQLNLPATLPDVHLTIVSNDRFRYYQNVCTTSYSFVWWTWSDWEKHIDWMAMNGFNLVLAFNGQEALWQRVYRKLNLTEQEIDEHFGGPAFLSWSRMGNLRGWGGPLSQSWHDKSLQLQRAILNRIRSLGIIPVLPAFSGHLPVAFKRLYPDAKMTRMASWVGMQDKYCCPYLLEPVDPLFNKIGTMFIQEQIAEYGTDHIYNCDTFNEMNPSNSEPKYLAEISNAIFGALTKGDFKAVWILQGWMFHYAESFWKKPLVEAFITAVPKGRMIVLDLYSELYPMYEKLDSYFGQPYIWCMLHNFGGNLGMYGAPKNINKIVIEARKIPNSSMIGIGLTPEGINQNYVIYDLMIEQGWRNTSADLNVWMHDYSVRRYGKENIDATTAWNMFMNNIYSNVPPEGYVAHCVLIKTPGLNIFPQLYYNVTDFALSWDKLLDAADDLKNNVGYRHDVVDTTRQFLQIIGDVYYRDLVNAFWNKQAKELKSLIEFYEELFVDMELILTSNKAFLLGNWIESAKALANGTKESALFELNARNQITLWGPRGEIRDYAVKQWSGLMPNYYAKRWKTFMTAMYNSVVNNTTFVESEIVSKVYEKVELPFTLSNETYPTEPSGDSITIAKSIHKKWRSKLKETKFSKQK